MKAFRLGLALLVAAMSVRADNRSEAILNYAGSTSEIYSTIYSAINGPVGFTFQPLTTISVTELGYFDYILTRPGSISVGLWAADGTLLASNTITSGSLLLDQSRYESITPIFLQAGETYYVAAFSATGPFSAVAVDPNDGAANGYATSSPEIQIGQVAYENNSVFGFPATLDGLPGSAIIAPNFEFQVVPEPTALGLMGAGLFFWPVIRRRT